ESSTLMRSLREWLTPDEMPDACVPVTSLKHTPSGDVDFEALRSAPVVDDALLRDWQNKLRDEHSLDHCDLGQSYAPRSERIFHGSDLVPGWRAPYHADVVVHATEQPRPKRAPPGRAEFVPSISHGPPLPRESPAPETLLEIFRSSVETGSGGYLY